MERQKKNMSNLAAGNRPQHIQSYLFRIRFEFITTMIVQSTTFIADFFKIQSSYSPTPSQGEPEKKSVEPCSREQSRANSELFFELGSTLSLQWLFKIPSSELTYFGLKVLIAERVSLEARKKNLLNRLAGNSAGQIQSYPSKWVWHYHYNDCAKYHFHN